MRLITHVLSKSKFFPVTYAILALCCFVFLINMLQEHTSDLTPIQHALLFDDPKAVGSAAPLFEKIRQGQVWRFVTPIFMHQDVLHIFFNMSWLLILGRQIELRLKKSKFLFLILLLAIFSNTSQYLMSGPYFLGISGVITGLAGFIWARQSKAPWEGYEVQKTTLTFLFTFVLILFFISAVCFILNALGWRAFSSSMANTAHISGGLLGLILGWSSFFARRLL